MYGGEFQPDTKKAVVGSKLSKRKDEQDPTKIVRTYTIL